MKINIYKIIAIALLGASSAFGHASSIKPEFVDTLLKPYFEIQASLAGDDFEKAKQNASTLQSLLEQGPSQERAHSLADLSSDTQKIIDAADIKSARNAFHEISKNLSEIVDHVGTSGNIDVLKMSCPMAFGGKGGEWLQSSKDLRNPYYGAMMLKCGAVQEQLVSAKAKHDH